MRVTITHNQKTTGLVFKKTVHEVHTKVDFSEEERHIISDRKLQDWTVLERVPFTAKSDDDPRWYFLTIGKLMKGTDVFPHETPIEAKNYEAELKDCLKALKEFLNENVETGGTTTFEL